MLVLPSMLVCLEVVPLVWCEVLRVLGEEEEVERANEMCSEREVSVGCTEETSLEYVPSIRMTARRSGISIIRCQLKHSYERKLTDIVPSRVAWRMNGGGLETVIMY